MKEGEKNFPFCSDRCRWVDLGHWLDEDYRIPVSGPGAAEEPDDDPEGEGEGDRALPPRPRGGP